MNRFVRAARSHGCGENSARYTNAVEATAVRENTIHRASRASVTNASGAATKRAIQAGLIKCDGRKRPERKTSARRAPAIRPARRGETVAERTTACPGG